MERSEVHWPSFLRELNATELAWKTYEVRYPREDAVPWMPYPMSQFVVLMTDAIMAAPPHHGGPHTPMMGRLDDEPWGPPWMLDVGCGPGTKIRLAEAMFGVKTYGIDIVPRFIAEAQAHKVRATVADAFDFGQYENFQIVMVNRPSGLQDELESLIMEKMASDAVLIAINWRNNPAKDGWITVSEEFGEPVCGVYVKP